MIKNKVSLIVNTDCGALPKLITPCLTKSPEAPTNPPPPTPTAETISYNNKKGNKLGFTKSISKKKGGCKYLTQVRGGITFSNIIRLSSTK